MYSLSLLTLSSWSPPTYVSVVFWNFWLLISVASRIPMYIRPIMTSEIMVIANIAASPFLFLCMPGLVFI